MKIVKGLLICLVAHTVYWVLITSLFKAAFGNEFIGWELITYFLIFIIGGVFIGHTVAKIQNT